MNSRYTDKSKLITDVNELRIINDTEVLICEESLFYREVVVELKKDSVDRFEELKPFIKFIAENLYKMDEIAKNYEKDDKFVYEYELATVHIDAFEKIRLTYYGMSENTEFDVVFEVNNGNFLLRKFGLKDII